jgi:hypothetical protein
MLSPARATLAKFRGFWSNQAGCRLEAGGMIRRMLKLSAWDTASRSWLRRAIGIGGIANKHV